MQNQNADSSSENARCEVCGRLKALHHGKNMCDYFNVSAKTDTGKLQADEDMPCVFCGNPKSKHYGRPGKVQPGDRFRLNSGWASITPGWATVVSLNGDVVEFRLDGIPNLSTMSVKDVPDTGPAFRCRPDYTSSTYMPSTQQKCQRCEQYFPRTVPIGQYWMCPECASSEKSIAERVKATEERKPLPFCVRCKTSPATSYFETVRVCRNCFDALTKRKALCTGSANDPVNRPAHYTFGKIEVADAIDDWQLNIWRGLALKYIVRAGRKHKETELEDLKKAAWYLAREIGNMERKMGKKA